MEEDNKSIEMPEEVKQALKRDAEKTTTASSSSTTTSQANPVFTQQSDQASKFEYPSEVVDLPSQGSLLRSIVSTCIW